MTSPFIFPIKRAWVANLGSSCLFKIYDISIEYICVSSSIYDDFTSISIQLH